VDVVRLLYNWLYVVGLLRRARTRAGVELLDEGIYQLLWSVGFVGDERAVRELSSTVPLPDVVVMVEAPLELIQARLVSRGSRDGRLDRMGDTERHAVLVRGADLLNELLPESDGHLGQASGPLLRRVRNGESGQLEADLAGLVEELASLAG
jgi:hypothetical protein